MTGSGSSAAQHGGEIAIRLADPRHPSLSGIHRRHGLAMRAETPPGSVHMLAPDALDRPHIRFFAMHLGDRAIGMAAWARLSATEGEIKSMHVLSEHRRAGRAWALLSHLIEDARGAGIDRLSLETGAQPGFAAARAFYARAGFEPCGPFGPYRPDPASVFMTRQIGES